MGKGEDRMGGRRMEWEGGKYKRRKMMGYLAWRNTKQTIFYSMEGGEETTIRNR